jgi:predicted ATPase
VAHELLRRAQSIDDPMLRVLAHYAVGLTSLHTGEFLLAREHQEKMLSLYDQERDKPLSFRIGNDAKQGVLSYAGWTLWHLGYPDQALEKSKEAISTAHATSDPNSLAGAEFFSTIVRLLRREHSLALEGAEDVMALSTERGLGAWLLFAPLHHGWAKLQLGHLEEGFEQIRQITAVIDAAGAHIGWPGTLSLLAEGYSASGRIEDALATIAEALAAVEEQAERMEEPEIHRRKGEILLRQSPSNAAERMVSRTQ